MIWTLTERTRAHIVRIFSIIISDIIILVDFISISPLAHLLWRPCREPISLIARDRTQLLFGWVPNLGTQRPGKLNASILLSAPHHVCVCFLAHLNLRPTWPRQHEERSGGGIAAPDTCQVILTNYFRLTETLLIGRMKWHDGTVVYLCPISYFLLICDELGYTRVISPYTHTSLSDIILLIIRCRAHNKD